MINEEYVDLVYNNLEPAYNKEYEDVVIRPNITRNVVKVVLTTAYLVTANIKSAAVPVPGGNVLPGSAICIPHACFTPRT